jgi:hypothetical protein
MSQTKLYYLKKCSAKKDESGYTITEYSEPIPIRAEIYLASGQMQAMTYGLRVIYIMNMLFDPNDSTNKGVTIDENDYICVNVGETDEPDYKVVSKKVYTKHQLFEIEKVVR